MKLSFVAFYLSTLVSCHASHAPANAPTLRNHKENLSRMILGHRDLTGDDLSQVTNGAISALADLFESRLHVSSHHANGGYDFEDRYLQDNRLLPSSSPSCIPTFKSTKAPSVKSTKAPSVKSTKAPSVKSTKAPSVKSTKAPSVKSTKAPSVKSTKAPSVKKTKAPSVKSTKAPSVKSTKAPSVKKTKAPSVKSTKAPSVKKTKAPSVKSVKCRSAKVTTTAIFVANARPKSALENEADNLVMGESESFALCLLVVGVAVAAVLTAISKFKREQRNRR